MRFCTALLLKMYIFSNLNLRNNLRKTEGGEGVMGNLRLYLRKTRGGGGGSRDVSPKGKRKELEVFTHGPLSNWYVLSFTIWSSLEIYYL